MPTEEMKEFDAGTPVEYAAVSRRFNGTLDSPNANAFRSGRVGPPPNTTVVPTVPGGATAGTNEMEGAPVEDGVPIGVPDTDELNVEAGLPDTDDVNVKAGLPDTDDDCVDAGLPDTDDVTVGAGLPDTEEVLVPVDVSVAALVALPVAVAVLVKDGHVHKTVDN